MTWRGLFWRSLFSEVFIGQVWENSGKNPSHTKKFPAPTPMLTKIVVAKKDMSHFRKK